MIWFIVRKQEGSVGCVITNGFDRESAKVHAQKYLCGDPDKYVVTPLTSESETVRLNVVV